MAETFVLKLITPTGVVFDGQAEQVTATNELGEFGVLPQHINFITSLIPSVLIVKLPDGYQRFVVTGGLAEVRDGAMSVLAPELQRPDAVDRGQASRDLDSAERKLATISFYEPEYLNAERELRLARARCAAVELASANH